jgi:hypothetical protein
MSIDIRSDRTTPTSADRIALRLKPMVMRCGRHLSVDRSPGAG